MTKYTLDLTLHTTKIYKNDNYNKPLFFKNNDDKISELKNSMTYNIVTGKFEYTPFEDIFGHNNFSVFENVSYFHGNKIEKQYKFYIYINHIFQNLLKTKNCEVVIILSMELNEIISPHMFEYVDVNDNNFFFKQMFDLYNENEKTRIIYKGCLIKEVLFSAASHLLFSTMSKNFLSLYSNYFYLNELTDVKGQSALTNGMWNTYYKKNTTLYNVFVKDDFKDSNSFELDYYNVTIPVGEEYTPKIIKENNHKISYTVYNNNDNLIEMNEFTIKALAPGDCIVIFRTSYDKHMIRALQVHCVEKTENNKVSYDNSSCIYLDVDEEISLNVQESVTNIIRYDYDYNFVNVRNNKIIGVNPGYSTFLVNEYQYDYFEEESLQSFHNHLKLLRLGMTKENFIYLIDYIYKYKNDIDNPYLYLYTQDEELSIDCSSFIQYKKQKIKEDVLKLYDNFNHKNNLKLFIIVAIENLFLEEELKELFKNNELTISKKYNYKTFDELILKFSDFVLYYNALNDSNSRPGFNTRVNQIKNMDKNYCIEFLMYDGMRYNCINELLMKNEMRDVLIKLNIISK